MSMNLAVLLGHVGADPEIRTSQSGDAIATFRVATSETWKDKATGERRESTEWHTIVVFNPQVAKIVEQFVKKGSRVSVQGQIKTRKWQDRDGKDRWSTEIVVGRFQGLIGLEGQPTAAAREERSYGATRTRDDPRTQSGTAGSSTSRHDDDLNDDIPF